MKPLGELEVLEDGSVHCPVSRPHKSVPTQVAHATQAGRSEESVGKIESVGPLGVRRIHVVRDCIRAIIGHPVQVVVRSHIETFGRIEGGRFASACSTSHQIWGPGKAPSSEGRPVGAALERPDPVPLPSAENRPQPSVSLLEKRQLPDVIEGKSVTDVEDGVTTVQTGNASCQCLQHRPPQSRLPSLTVVPSRSGINRVAPGIVSRDL